MKPWSRFCCTVLVLCLATRGRHGATVSPGSEELNTQAEGAVVTTTPENAVPSHDSRPSSPAASAQSPTSTSENATATNASGSAGGSVAVTTGTAPDPPLSGTPGPPMATVTMETNVTSSTTTSPGGHSSSWGYVILVLIVVVIVVLCVILYFLRKASKTYSFELQRQTPPSNLHQPSATFEAVYLDDLGERPIPKDLGSNEESSPPAATNGGPTLGRPGDGDGDGDGGAAQVQPTGEETSPPGDGGGAAPGGAAPGGVAPGGPRSSEEPLLDPDGRRSGETDNTPGCPLVPFVDVSLDESPWTDQLLVSPEAPSSVLPFSPFSF